MLPVVVITVFLMLATALAMGRSLYESKKSRGSKVEAEPTRNEAILVLGAVFALIFYAESVAYIVLALSGNGGALTSGFLQLRFPFDSFVQVSGMALVMLGYVLVFCGLRDLEYGKLTTKGTYGYVRHPQYLGFSIILVGFFLTLLNLIALVPLLVIPAEIHEANEEEEFLTRKFGEAYAKYQQKTGKFIPRIKANKLGADSGDRLGKG